MTVSELIARAKEGSANTKELGILCGIRQIRFADSTGSSYVPEHFFTLKEWREIYDKGEEVSLDEAIQVVPELSFLNEE